MPATVSPVDPADTGTRAPVEPELYLRLVGEQTVLARDDHGLWGQGDLGSAASALVAVGLLPVTVAVGVVQDYQLAAGLRGDHHHRMMPPGPPATPLTKAPTAPVVALCRPAGPPPGQVGGAPGQPGEDGSWAWDVRYVLLGDTETVVSVRSSTPPPGEQRHLVPGHPGQPTTCEVADDTGHVEQGDFTGGGGDAEWSGAFTTASALSPTTRWLEFDGRRLDLERPASPPTVRLEAHGDGGPAERYLHHQLAVGHLGPGHGGDDDRPDAAVEALVATGAIDVGAPAVAELAAVRAARATGRFGHGGGPLRGLPRRYSTFPPSRGGPPRSPAPAGPPELPDAWASVLRAGAAPGPVGVVPLGVATPIVEGAAAVLRALVSTADHFTIDTVQVGGETSMRHGDHVEQTPSFAWWAQDDRGQWYRGDWNGWSGGDEGMTGEVLYTPPLDPRARTLRLLPTMPSLRAVVEVALPEWRTAT